MNSKIKLKRVYIPAFFVIAASSVALRTAALFTNYSVKSGFFEEKALIHSASAILIFGIAVLFSYAFSGAKNDKLIASFSTPATYVPTGAVSVAMLFFATLTAIKSSKTGFSASSIIKIVQTPGATASHVLSYISANMLNLLLSALVPLSLLAVGYFILNACVLERASRARAFFGITNVLFLALYACFLYFDKTLSINAPNKIVDQMAFIFAALFFLYETRISLGRECWHLYVAFGLGAAALTAYSSIPSLIFYFARGAVISNNIQENVLTFALFIFISARIILASALPEDKGSNGLELLFGSARERASYVKEKELAQRRAYLELYGRLDNLDEDEEFKEDTEFDGDGSFSEPVQMTLDEALGLSGEASPETEISEDIFSAEAGTETAAENGEQTDGFEQESINFEDVFPANTQENPDEKTAESN